MSRKNITLDSFDLKYNDRGGFKKLSELQALKCTVKTISDHFEVDRSTASMWLRRFFGENYDPRKERKEAFIQSMVEFSKTHTILDFWITYNRKSGDYVKEALRRCVEQNIYK
jgi:hypothetical protein